MLCMKYCTYPLGIVSYLLVIMPFSDFSALFPAARKYFLKSILGPPCCSSGSLLSLP